MTSDAFHVWVLLNPPLEFDPDEEVWRDSNLDGCRTVAEFVQSIFAAFERWVSHGFEVVTRDEAGIALRRCVHPHLSDGGPSWPPVDHEAIDRFIDQAVPADAFGGNTDQFREFQSDSPTEGNAADTTIDDPNPDELRSLSDPFIMGAGWDYSIERQEPREGSLVGGPTVIGKQGEGPPLYRDLDE